LVTIDIRNANWMSEYSSTVRSILNMALKFAIVALDFAQVSAILSFSHHSLLILLIEGADLDLLLLTESFASINELVVA